MLFGCARERGMMTKDRANFYQCARSRAEPWHRFLPVWISVIGEVSHSINPVTRLTMQVGYGDNDNSCSVLAVNQTIWKTG